MLSATLPLRLQKEGEKYPADIATSCLAVRLMYYKERRCCPLWCTCIYVDSYTYKERLARESMASTLATTAICGEVTIAIEEHPRQNCDQLVSTTQAASAQAA